MRTKQAVVLPRLDMTPLVMSGPWIQVRQKHEKTALISTWSEQSVPEPLLHGSCKRNDGNDDDDDDDDNGHDEDEAEEECDDYDEEEEDDDDDVTCGGGTVVAEAVAAALLVVLVSSAGVSYR